MILPASIFDFLAQLERNNNRDWFKANKSVYDGIMAFLDGFIIELIERISAFDPSVRRETPKTSMFRIYRDLRFSPDKTPYKIHFGIYIAPGGKSSPHAGYYLHLQPGASEFAGGLWCPQADILQKIRQEIYYEPEKLDAIVRTPAFTKYFGSLLETQKLKRPPKDYPADFQYVDYLKYKHFIGSRSYTDQQVLSSGFEDDVIESAYRIYPLVQYINTIIMDY